MTVKKLCCYNGNIDRLQRRGRKQDGVYGEIDDLHIFHNGNQLTKVVDDTEPLLYAGAFDFKDDDNSLDVEYTYDGNGALTSDRNRGIALIEYDDWNNPRRIQFTNGNVTEYVYSATGEKLRTTHYTVVSNITVPMGERHELTPGEIQYKDSTEYVGNLIVRNGKPHMYLFDGDTVL